MGRQRSRILAGVNGWARQGDDQRQPQCPKAFRVVEKIDKGDMTGELIRFNTSARRYWSFLWLHKATTGMPEGGRYGLLGKACSLGEPENRVPSIHIKPIRTGSLFCMPGG